jgi:superfamily I DNA/RNA helicase
MTQIAKNLSQELNEEQITAVSTIEGPLLVLAGAGTGKTRVITYRIAHMIDSGIPPENIAGMTFTNKAAKEMRERLESVVAKSDAQKVYLGTFHSFCARLLRKEISPLGYTPNFTIADDTDQNGILKQVLAEMGVKKDLVNASFCLAMIGKVKSELVAPEEIYIGDTVLSSIFPDIYKRYQQVLKNQNLVDFDDLLLLTVQLFEQEASLLEKYRKQYRYLLVDEYQDTNFLQFRLLELLIGDNHNLCVVGDDDQSIYGWRGAKIENILNFPKKFKGAKHIKLEQNYRSTNIILKVSNSLISCNKTRHEKELWSNCGEGNNIRFIESDSGIEESQFIADSITDLHAGKDLLPYKDIAILYRSNYLSREVENALRNSHIPYRLVGGQSFYERKEVRDAVAYLKILANNKDDQSLLRIIGAPPRGIGDKAIERLKKLQAITHLPLSDLLNDSDFTAKLSSKANSGATQLASCFIKYKNLFQESGGLADKVQNYLRDVGYLDGLLKMYKNRDESEKRRDNVLELINAVGQYEMREGASATLVGFIENYSLVDDNDKTDEEEEESVTLMTIHAAKGLEFPAVFIIGMEENLFPNERALNEGALEEERRLFYVAITRAKHTLTMTRARERIRFGKISRQRPSQFIAELPEEYIDKMNSRDAFQKVTPEALQKAFENFTFD